MSDVVISAHEPPIPWSYGGSIFTVRYFYDQPFLDSDNRWVPAGDGQQGFYISVEGTIDVNGILHIPDSTIISPLGGRQPNALCSAQLFDEQGVGRDFLFTGWTIPQTTPTTFGALEIVNENQTLVNVLGYILTTAQILQVQALINIAVGLLNKASAVIYGILRLSISPADATDPIAKGDNDPLVIDAKSFASINAAVTAIGSTPARLSVSTSMALAGDLVIPATMELHVVKGGQITGAHALTILGPFSAGAFQVFGSSTTVSFGNTAPPAIDPLWWGATASGGIKEAYTAAPASTGANLVMGGGVTISTAQSLTLSAGKPLYLNLRGNVITFTHTSGVGLTITNPMANRYALQIENGEFTYSGASTGVTGLKIVGGLSVLIQSVRFSQFATSGATALVWDGVQDSDILARFFHNSNNLILQNDTNANRISIKVDGATESAVKILNGSSSNHIKNSVIQDCTGIVRVIQLIALNTDTSLTMGLFGNTISNTWMENNGDTTANVRQIYIMAESMRSINGFVSFANQFTPGANGANGVVYEFTGAGSVDNPSIISNTRPAGGFASIYVGGGKPTNAFSCGNDDQPGKCGFGTLNATQPLTVFHSTAPVISQRSANFTYEIGQQADDGVYRFKRNDGVVADRLLIQASGRVDIPNTLLVTGNATVLGAFNFAADTGSTDAYAITLSPAPAAYTIGMYIAFTANTANTGACSINVNGLGAKALKRGVSTDPPDNFIKAGSLVLAIYDGVNFQLVTPAAQ